MKYYKATLAAWKRTGMNTVHCFMLLSSFLGAVLIFFAALSSNPEAHSTALIGILLLGMTVFYLRSELLNRYGIFNYRQSFEIKGLIVLDDRPQKMLQLMPFSRENVVRAFVNFERFTNALIVVPMLVFIARAFMQSFYTPIVIVGSVLCVFVMAGLSSLEKTLLTYDVKKIANKLSLGTLCYTIFMLYVAFGSKLTEFKFDMPVLSIFFAAIALIAGVVFIIGSEKVHKQLIADCKSRSFTGEPIGGAE